MKNNQLSSRNETTNKYFINLFWTTTFLSVISIIFLLFFVFILPHDASNLKYNQKLLFGFYTLKLLETGNTLSLSWAAYVGSILTVVSSISSIFFYWIYRNSYYATFVNKHQLFPLLICLNVFIVILFLINIFSKPLLDIKQLDMVKNGWNFKPELSDYKIDFNYVYSIRVINIPEQESQIKIVGSQYMILWIFLITLFLITISTFYIVLFYNSKDYLVFKKRENHV
ncbi:MAG: hypothetical protein ACRC4L_00570 [Mycoplasma sp.]